MGRAHYKPVIEYLGGGVDEDAVSAIGMVLVMIFSPGRKGG